MLSSFSFSVSIPVDQLSINVSLRRTENITMLRIMKDRQGGEGLSTEN